MKLAEKINVRILSRSSMRKPEDFIARLRHHCEVLHELLPEKWGFWEPLENKFEINQINSMIPDDRSGAADDWIWKRTKNPKAEGSLNVAWKSAVEGLLNGHAHERFNYKSGDISTDMIVKYIQQSCVMFSGDIALIDSCMPEYYERYMKDYYRYGGTVFMGTTIGVDTHTLRHWLPDVYWGTVFGSAYVKMFGLETLLSAPAYEVKKLSDECVYLQLSPNLQDLYDDFNAVQKVRDAVKDHLGRDAFFSLDKAYPLRGPIGEPPDYAVSGAELMSFQVPDPIGTVFRVPDFQLIPDEYMI